MSTHTLSALLFRFPFPGTWGKDLTERVARAIGDEAGLVWKIWLDDRETGHISGVYLFEDAAAADRYRERHARRLAAMGLAGVTADVFPVESQVSVLTMAAAALGLGCPSKAA